MTTDMIDRQTAFSGTIPADIPVAALEHYLSNRLPGFSGPLSVSRFKGGQSNPTYHLTTASGDYVLRRKPYGKLLPSAHAIEREFRVTLALHSTGFPLARPRLLCGNEAIIGSAFYVMDFVAGRIFWQPHAPGLSTSHRAAIFSSMNDAMARLHLLNPAKLGLADFGRPDNYLTRQIKRWSEQYRASETEKIDAMDHLIRWLPGACPATTEAAIIHGDFRLDNCIIHASEPRIIAVIDWELSTIGDPLADFTYHLMQWFMPVSEHGAGVGSLIGHENDPGIPRLADDIESYCEKTGRAAIPQFNFYMAYNFFRLAAILQGILGRVRDGTAANADAGLMARQVAPLAQTAWRFARKAGA